MHTPTINSLKHKGNSQGTVGKPHFLDSAVHNESLLPAATWGPSGATVTFQSPFSAPGLQKQRIGIFPRVLCKVIYASVSSRIRHLTSHILCTCAMASASPAASGGMLPPEGSVLDLVLAGVLANKLIVLILSPAIAVFLWLLVSYQTSPLKKYPGPFLAGMWLVLLLPRHTRT